MHLLASGAEKVRSKISLSMIYCCFMRDTVILRAMAGISISLSPSDGHTRTTRCSPALLLDHLVPG